MTDDFVVVTLGFGWRGGSSGGIFHDMRPQRLAIFGGSFNPIHLGHLIAAQDAETAFGLDRILFVPAAIPPHKLTQTLVTPAQRLDMVRLALGEHERWEVSDVEIRRGGVSYSIDTVRHFHEVYPEDELYLIIGGDTLPELHTWKDIDALLALCRVITMVRPGFDPESLQRADLNLKPRQVDDLVQRVTMGHFVGISATEIRMRVAKKEAIRYLVPDPVDHFIHEHGLYHK